MAANGVCTTVRVGDGPYNRDGLSTQSQCDSHRFISLALGRGLQRYECREWRAPCASLLPTRLSHRSLDGRLHIDRHASVPLKRLVAKSSELVVADKLKLLLR